MNAERRPVETGAASWKSFGGDDATVPPSADTPPAGVPLWHWDLYGFKPRPPGPTTEDERRHLSYAAHDRARGYELERAYGRQYVAEFGGAA